MITVEALIEFLNTLPKHYFIILSTDAEGNRYSPMLRTTERARYVPENIWWGELKAGTKKKPENAIVLHPSC